MYNVQIKVDGCWQVSRLFNSVRAARNWATWCSKKWETKIYTQLGGIQVPPYHGQKVPKI